MYFREISFLFLIIGGIVKFLGVIHFCTLVIVICTQFLAFIVILLAYTSNSNHYANINGELVKNSVKTLGLTVCSIKKPEVHVVSPNINIQTERKIEKSKTKFMELFKKHGNKYIKDGYSHKNIDFHKPKSTVEHETDTQQQPITETIKIHTDKSNAGTFSYKKKPDVSLGTECINNKLKNENDDVKSTKKYKIFSGKIDVDRLIHTIIEYVIRDFIDSWFSSISESKEFIDQNTRVAIEEFVANICKRIKQFDFVPLATTKLIDDLSNHTKLFRLSLQSTKNENLHKLDKNNKIPYQHNMKMEKSTKEHRRNKSDTDLKWNIGNSIIHKTIANSTFYSVATDENNLMDPKKCLIQTFFENSNNIFKKECLDDLELEKHLVHVMETILYFTISHENFSCLTLRSLMATLMANIVKQIINMLSDPDFINLQIARQLINETPPAEFLIRIIRQSNDLSELRAVRQLITSEMDIAYQDPNLSAELASLKFTQKLIDIRISNIQHKSNDNSQKMYFEKEKSANLKLPLDDILNRELALSYYLDYLSILNLQKYVIFYLVANDWKHITKNQLANLPAHQKEEILRQIRDKAFAIFKEYLMPSSDHFLNVDPGLIEVLHIKIKDTFIQPDSNWFDSISKFVYEKLKNEDIFLANFYESSAYKKLLLELDLTGHNEEFSSIHRDIKLNAELESYSNYSDDGEEDEDYDDMDLKENKLKGDYFIDICYKESQLKTTTPLLDPNKQKFHQRSHSDTGIIQFHEEAYHQIDPIVSNMDTNIPSQDNIVPPELKQKLSAKIIETAINTEGKFAVYAIQVEVIEGQAYKKWHIYRRYSKFLEFKKLLQKKFPEFNKLPFPAKKTFQNTQRNVLTFRMNVLNEFLMVICSKAQHNEGINSEIRCFLEPDQDDQKIHGSAINKIVNPLKSGMRSIRNMPDTFMDGLSRLFVGRIGTLKEHSFFDVISENSNEYPALTAVLNLMDEVFDLQARSQWLRKGLINRLLGAPWISNQANKKIVQVVKNLIEMNKAEAILTTILNNVWPDGVRNDRETPPREDSTKLRTRLVAKIAMFALLSDELKHVLGSETTRVGLYNFFEMLQHSQLNKRLVLILLHHILTTIFSVESMEKHIPTK